MEKGFNGTPSPHVGLFTIDLGKEKSSLSSGVPLVAQTDPNV